MVREEKNGEGKRDKMHLNIYVAEWREGGKLLSVAMP